MNNNWILDILELPEEIRNTTELTILRESPTGELEESQLNELAQDVKRLLNIEDKLTIIVCHYDGSFKSVFISLNEIEILLKLWIEWAGNYIIILPNLVNVELFSGFEIDDELIKFILINEKNLILKSCDGYQLFHICIKR